MVTAEVPRVGLNNVELDFFFYNQCYGGFKRVSFQTAWASHEP